MAYRLTEEDFRRYLVERLAEGVAEYRALEEISRQVDRYVVGVLAAAGVSPAASTSAVGAFAPHPPPYAEPLAEVLVRLAVTPAATAGLARAADDAFAGSYLSSLGLSTSDGASTEHARLLRIMAAFLERQTRVPGPLLMAVGVLTMTVHQAKGRVFDAVVLCDPNSSSFANREEDRRLFYVAITREFAAGRS